MKSSPAFNWLVALPMLFLNTTAIPPEKPANIHGTVVQHASGKIIENAYLYIISGEEEALTNKDGQFDIATWQPLPVTLVIEHQGYRQKKILIKNLREKQLVTLDPK